MRRIYIDIFSLKYIPPEGKKLRARVIIFTTNTLHTHVALSFINIWNYHE